MQTSPGSWYFIVVGEGEGEGTPPVSFDWRSRKLIERGRETSLLSGGLLREKAGVRRSMEHVRVLPTERAVRGAAIGQTGHPCAPGAAGSRIMTNQLDLVWEGAAGKQLRPRPPRVAAEAAHPRTFLVSMEVSASQRGAEWRTGIVKEKKNLINGRFRR